MLVLFWLGVLVGCSREPVEPVGPVDVSIDLTIRGRSFADAEPRPIRVDQDATHRRLVQEQPGALDFYFRRPSGAELRWRFPSDVASKTAAVSAEVDGALRTLDPQASGDGLWHAPVPGRAGEITRVRLQSSSTRSLAWIDPHVVGGTDHSPPIVAARFRPAKQPVNVVLYVVDTLRADRLSLYGYDRPTSPRLDQLASRALVFDNAYSAGAFTPPSLTALLSSRFPSELGGRLDTNGPARQTLAELFHRAGYATGAFQANIGLTPGLGYARGFERYDILSRDGPVGPRGADAATLHERALTWIREERGGRPFFILVQTMDVHFPYDPPPPFRDMFPPRKQAEPATEEQLNAMKRLTEEQIRKAFQQVAYLDPERYDNGVAYADHELGALLDALEHEGLAAETVIVITADHGEPLGDRGELIHGRSLYEELVRVPLVLVLPTSMPGTRVEDVVSLLDVAPTLVDLAGLPVPEQFVGRSWLQPGMAHEPPAAVGELIRNHDYALVGWYAREGPWKLIVDPAASARGYQLYHLPTDPKETKDVSDVHPLEARYLVDRATARPHGSTAAIGPVDQGLSEEERRKRNEALRALGYITSPDAR